MWKVTVHRPTDYGMTSLNDYTGTSVYIHVGRFSISFDYFPSVMFMAGDHGSTVVKVLC